jgi:hypothetical protein
MQVAVQMRNMFEIYGEGLQLDDLHSQPSNTLFSEPPEQQQPPKATPGAANAGTAGGSDEELSEPAGGVSSDGEQDLGESGSGSDDSEGRDLKWAEGGWLLTNPLNCPTEREHYVQQQGLPVYRVLLRKQ